MYLNVYAYNWISNAVAYVDFFDYERFECDDVCVMCPSISRVIINGIGRVNTPRSIADIGH